MLISIIISIAFLEKTYLHSDRVCLYVNSFLLEQNHFINSFHSSINLIENDAKMILLTKEEPLPANTLLAFLHLRDNDQLSNGFLTLNLQTYIQCSTEQIFISKITSIFFFK